MLRERGLEIRPIHEDIPGSFQLFGVFGVDDVERDLVGLDLRVRMRGGARDAGGIFIERPSHFGVGGLRLVVGELSTHDGRSWFLHGG